MLEKCFLLSFVLGKSLSDSVFIIIIISNGKFSMIRDCLLVSISRRHFMGMCLTRHPLPEERKKCGKKR